MSSLHFRNAPDVVTFKVTITFSWNLILTDFYIVFDNAIELSTLVVRRILTVKVTEKGKNTFSAITFERITVETSGLAQNIDKFKSS